METHKTILSAIRALAEFQPISVTIPFRGIYDVVFIDAYGIETYKIGSFDPLTIKWEELTPIEALRLKRECRYHLHLMLQEEEDWRRSSLLKIKELFRATPFGC